MSVLIKNVRTTACYVPYVEPNIKITMNK